MLLAWVRPFVILNVLYYVCLWSSIILFYFTFNANLLLQLMSKCISQTCCISARVLVWESNKSPFHFMACFELKWHTPEMISLIVYLRRSLKAEGIWGNTCRLCVELNQNKCDYETGIELMQQNFWILNACYVTLFYSILFLTQVSVPNKWKWRMDNIFCSLHLEYIALLHATLGQYCSVPRCLYDSQTM